MPCKPQVFTQLTLRTLKYNWFILIIKWGCNFISYFGDDVEDLLEDVIFGHVLRDGDIVGALLVIPRRLIHVEHLGEDSLMTSAENESEKSLVVNLISCCNQIWPRNSLTAWENKKVDFLWPTSNFMTENTSPAANHFAWAGTTDTCHHLWNSAYLFSYFLFKVNYN